jgi:predicted DNA-binding transcriptional regulator YafY
MGQRSTSDTITSIFFAFLEQGTWKLIELAKKIGVTPRTLTKHLEELHARGMLEEKESEHPHVYWSVQKGWFPGGVIFSTDEIHELLRVVSQAPRCRARAQAINKIMKAMGQQAPLRIAPAAVVPEEATEDEQRYRPIVEESIAQKVALQLKYNSVNRGSVEWRHLSVHAITVAPRARIVGFCHRARQLKWFRMSRVLEARLDQHEPYEAVPQDAVATYLRESIGGYHHGGAPIRCSFLVREPDSRWVADNLMPPMQAQTISGGIRVSCETAGLIQVARYVVSLGAAAKPETPELAQLVRELAEGALQGASVPSTGAVKSQ